jgi:hypothetical protein
MITMFIELIQHSFKNIKIFIQNIINLEKKYNFFIIQKKNLLNKQYNIKKDEGWGSFVLGYLMT